MSRKTIDLINADRIVLDLRMQAEDLINSMEALSDEDFRKESERIKSELEARIDTLLANQK